MKTIKIETQCKAAFTPDYKKAGELIEMAIQAITGGNKAFDNEALWILSKTVDSKGVLRNLPYWLNKCQDGFAMETGSAEGFEEAEGRIEAYQAGIMESYKSHRNDR